MIFWWFLLLILCAFTNNGAEDRDTCEIKDVLAIIKTNSDLIYQQVDSAGVSIQQHCVYAKHKILNLMEADTVPKIMVVMQNTLKNLQNLDDCTKKVQVHFNTLHNQVNLQYANCNAQLKNNEMFLENKFESTSKWIQTVKTMTGLVLEKCAMKHLYNDCTAMRSCCLGAAGHVIYKILETTKNSTDSIYTLLSEQHDCFNYVTKETLTMQKRIHDEIFKCSVRGGEPNQSQQPADLVTDESSEDKVRNRVFEMSPKNVLGTESNSSVQMDPTQDVKISDKGKPKN